MEEGDLGLGMGLKPGAISTQDDGESLPLGSLLDEARTMQSRRRRPDDPQSPTPKIGPNLKERAVSRLHTRRRSERREDGEEAENGGSQWMRLQRSNSVGSVMRRESRRPSPREEIPSFAGIAMGTSLRQQRELFQQGMKDFLEKKDKLMSSQDDVRGSAVPAAFFAVQKSLVDRLQSATEDVVILQNELEACRSQLDSKYRAIRILQSQVAVMNAEKQKNVDAVKDQARNLQKEVNALQFELDAKSSSYTFSEQTWAQRFDRLSVENTALLATLQARSDEVRRLHADKMGLLRERDELLALLDANERLRYDRYWSPKNETYIQSSESEQLAVLGSCLCRGNKPDPCRCAKTAAMLKKESSATKDENFALGERLQEAYLVADAFRKAFEDQLSRNAALSKQLADSSSPASSSSSPSSSSSSFHDGTPHGLVAERNGARRKPLLAWLKKRDAAKGHLQPSKSIGQLLADTLDIQALMVSERDEVWHDDRSRRSVGVQVSQPMPALIRNMADLLNDKSEALAHQRLVTKMLARRTQDLEATVKRYGDL